MAQTEEKEFRNIYQMDVIVIPTNKPVIRHDNDDAVYKTKKRNSMLLWMRLWQPMKRDSLFWWVRLRSRHPSF